MASHEVYNKDNKFLSKLKFKSKTLNILRNIVLSLVIILGLNWVIAITTDVNLLGTGLRKVFEAVAGYNKEIPSISFSSDDWSSPGSWRVNKRAEWTSANTAEVTFTLDTTAKVIESGDIVHPEVIIILDNSLSMVGEKLDKAKEHTINFIKKFLADEEESIALITFNDTATILTDFTRNETTLTDKVNSINAEGNTNYNDALKKAGEILENYYTHNGYKSVSILFVTDGVPCIDTPNEVATARLLKDKYNVAINGIQYEMGNTITPALERISDYTRYAARDTLTDVFMDLSTTHVSYDNFEIVDYVKDEYFYVKNENDINVTRGTIKLENQADGTQKIIWNLGENFKTGSSSSMTINLTLKEQYVTDVNKDFYPTNEKEEVNSKLPDENAKTKASTLTPVLQRIYNVTYLNNPPTGCSLSKEYAKEKHYYFENVKIKNDHPTCAGYNFKGWNIVENDVREIGGNKFTMPKHDVTLKALWGQQDISKSMKGQVPEKPTLYEIVQADARGAYGATIYEGEVTDQYNKTVTVKENAGTSDGIYYYTSKTHNNVIFAGFCWQMVRTTTTGGVKIVYNGIPVNGTCKDDRGYILTVTNPNYHLSIDSSDLYGDSYTYDSATGKINLTGNVQRADTFAKNDLIGKYTCYNSSGTNCSTLYHVNSLDPESSSYTYTTRYEPVHYSVVGESRFNYRYSPAYVGYMYNTVYEYNNEEIILDTALWGNGVEWKDNAYHLTDTVAGGIDVNHHYTCATMSSTEVTDTCTEVRYYYEYFSNRYGSNVYHYITLQNGTTIEQALIQMLSADDVNTTNSDIKTYIDEWYQNNMTNYTKYLEDTVFCNDRGISDLRGWNPNGGLISAYSSDLQFNNYSYIQSTHICPNITDQFAMNNSKAQLTYPVGLLTVPEANMIGSTFTTTGEEWWLGSPYDFYGNDGAVGRYVGTSGGLGRSQADYSRGVRPVVSLTPGTKYTSGAGTPEDPFIIETK